MGHKWGYVVKKQLGYEGFGHGFRGSIDTDCWFSVQQNWKGCIIKDGVGSYRWALLVGGGLRTFF